MPTPNIEELHGMAWAAIDDLPPKERLLLAREIVHTLIENGVDYADFRNAKYVERHLRVAHTNLQKASLA